MAEVAFPILLLTDKTLFGELSPLFANTAKQLGARNLPNAILIFEVCDAPEWAHATVKGSENPERMLVMTFKAESRDAVARTVAAVGQRHLVPADKKKSALTMKESTPLRNFFRQMSEVPLNIFSLSHAATPGSTLFFLRTAPVIADFKRELPNVLGAAGGEAGAASPGGKSSAT